MTEYCKRIRIQKPYKDKESVLYGLVSEGATHYTITTRLREHVYRKDCIISIESTDRIWLGETL